MAFNQLPIIRAHLRKLFSRVIAESTYSFDGRRVGAMYDRGLYVVEGSSKLVYDDHDISFEVPEGRYVWIAVAAGQVMELVAGATERAIPLEEAYKRAVHVTERLTALPFEAKKPMQLTLADLRRKIGQVTTDSYEIPLAQCRLQDVQWTLRLSWLGSSAPSPKDAYILSMRWSSETVERELIKKVLEMRILQGNKYEALPLSVWLKGS